VNSNKLSRANLEPMTRHFLDTLLLTGAFPLSARSASKIRSALTKLQSGPIGKPDACIKDITFPVGPRGEVSVRIVRPRHDVERIPVVMFFHGGGWVAGDAHTHDRLIREIAIGVHAAVVFVKYARAPEIQYPIPVEEAYAATAYVVEHAVSLNLDGTRLAVVGDGTGGNIAAAVAIMSKQRRGPKIIFQVLFYPVIASNFRMSFQDLHEKTWLTKQDMEWFRDAYFPDQESRESVTGSPLAATIDQLRGLPDALLITAEIDVLCEEAEAYARKLSEAYVRTTCVRYVGTIHDFVMLNALADTPAARGAIGQANAMLKAALA
jgi:acetyl esterase